MMAEQIEPLRRVIAADEGALYAYEFLYGDLYTIGEVAESFELMKQYWKKSREEGAKRGLDQLDYEMVSGTLLQGSIGIVTNVDSYRKSSILGLAPEKKPLLLDNGNSNYTNPHYLTYLQDLFTWVKHSNLCAKLSEYQAYLNIPLNWIMALDGKAMFFLYAQGIIHERWAKENRGPLLALTDEDRCRGREVLARMGMPKDAWFVCFHVRETGFHEKKGSRGTEWRNGDIRTYFKAIKTVTKAGGWVLRMGNPIMEPLPVMEQVIDYAHCNGREDWMDIFCCAESRFFVGTSSGLYMVAMAFGVPCIQTNCLPTNWIHSFTAKDLFIPRKLYNIKKNRYLTFAEMFDDPVSAASMQFRYEELDLRVEPNTEEQLQDLVEEAIERVEGCAFYSKEDECLQRDFRQITESCAQKIEPEAIGVVARIGRAFLRENAELLNRK